MIEELITLNQLCESNKIYWIKSLPTLRKWVMQDIKTNDFLKAKVINREGTGTRYYIPVKNISTFINAFNERKIFTKEKKQ